MKLQFDQSGYWNKVAHEKTFNHPLDWELWNELVGYNQFVLDYGCGYGRLLHKLWLIGYRNLLGIDASSEMIQRAKKLNDQIEFRVNQENTIPLPDNSIDGILLFAVLTCIPQNIDQQYLIAELYRILRPNGIIYISDLLLNQDQRNLERYKKYEPKYDVYGVFELTEGGVFRHHSWEWINSLFGKFSVQRNKELTFTTMNGNQSKGFQLIVKK